MLVYAVFEHNNITNADEMCGIFSTEDKANNFIEYNSDKLLTTFHHYIIKEILVDENEKEKVIPKYDLYLARILSKNSNTKLFLKKLKETATEHKFDIVVNTVKFSEVYPRLSQYHNRTGRKYPDNIICYDYYMTVPLGMDRTQAELEFGKEIIKFAEDLQEGDIAVEKHIKKEDD